MSKAELPKSFLLIDRSIQVEYSVNWQEWKFRVLSVLNAEAAQNNVVALALLKKISQVDITTVEGCQTLMMATLAVDKFDKALSKKIWEGSPNEQGLMRGGLIHTPHTRKFNDSVDYYEDNSFVRSLNKQPVFQSKGDPNDNPSWSNTRHCELSRDYDYSFNTAGFKVAILENLNQTLGITNAMITQFNEGLALPSSDPKQTRPSSDPKQTSHEVTVSQLRAEMLEAAKAKLQALCSKEPKPSITYEIGQVNIARQYSDGTYYHRQKRAFLPVKIFDITPEVRAELNREVESTMRTVLNRHFGEGHKFSEMILEDIKTQAFLSAAADYSNSTQKLTAEQQAVLTHKLSDAIREEMTNNPEKLIRGTNNENNRQLWNIICITVDPNADFLCFYNHFEKLLNRYADEIGCKDKSNLLDVARKVFEEVRKEYEFKNIKQVVKNAVQVATKAFFNEHPDAISLSNNSDGFCWKKRLLGSFETLYQKAVSEAVNRAVGTVYADNLGYKVSSVKKTMEEARKAELENYVKKLNETALLASDEVTSSSAPPPPTERVVSSNRYSFHGGAIGTINEAPGETVDANNARSEGGNRTPRQK